MKEYQLEGLFLSNILNVGILDRPQIKRRSTVVLRGAFLLVKEETAVILSRYESELGELRFGRVGKPCTSACRVSRPSGELAQNEIDTSYSR